MGGINKQGQDSNAAVDVNFDGNDGMTLMGTGQDVIAVIRDSYLLGRLWVKGSRN
jgi:hypothetical protein